MLGAWAVLFKTLYVATAANSRLTADFLIRLGVWQTDGPAKRDRIVKLFCVLYPTLSLGLYYAFREPQALIKAGGIAQALMLPFIAGATIYLRRRDTDPRVGPVVAQRWPYLDRILRHHGRGGLQLVRPDQGPDRRPRATVSLNAGRFDLAAPHDLGVPGERIANPSDKPVVIWSRP